MSLGGREQAKKNSPAAVSEAKKAAVKLKRPPPTRDELKHILLRVGAGIIALVVLAGVVVGYDKFF